MRNAARLGAGLAGVMAFTAAVATAKVPDTYVVAPGTADSAAITDCSPAAASTFSCANLRSAVASADGDNGSTVQLAAGAYTLSVGQLTINTDNALTIAGVGSGQTTVAQSAGSGHRVLTLTNLSGAVTIRGLTLTGGDQATVDGSCTANSGEVDGGGILNAGTLTLSDVTVSGNQATGTDGANASSGSAGMGAAANGGGICSSGPLTVIDSTITGNRATGGDGGKGTASASGGWGGTASGGGIEATGNLTLTGTAVGSNQAIGGGAGKVTGTGDGGNGGGASGGAISVDQGQGFTNPTASITDGRIEGNAEAGGTGAQVAAASPLINVGGAAFGAISGGSFGAITITRSTIASNTASGGAAGTRGGGASGGDGGNAGGAGMYMGVAPLTLTASTVSGNTAVGGPAAVAPGGSGGSGFGGGLYVENQTAIVNSTIADNRLSVSAGARANGGGLYAEQIGDTVTTLASVTLAANSVTAVTPSMAAGGNLDHPVPSPITASDTIIAGGSTNGTGANCGHKIATDAGHNLESTSPSECGLGAAPGDLIGVDPLLGQLTTNGGTTQTLALGAGSPAIGAGGQCTDPTGGGQPLAADQRGQPRPNPCDIGAFEGQPPATATRPSITGTKTVGKTVTCSPGTYTGDAPLAAAFQWQRDGKAIAGAGASTRKVALADAGHKLACVVTETNPYGQAAATSAELGVPFPVPVLGRIHQSHKRWREGSKLAKISRKGTAVGTTFSFTLTVPGRLTLGFRHGHRKAGTLALTAKRTGRVRIRFDGRVSKHRRLSPGRYKLTITAKAHGKRSKPRTASFTIV
jgi:hypothetical protein